MTRLQRILIFALAILPCSRLEAQQLIPDSLMRSAVYDANVKQFDQFVDRFNGETDFRGAAIAPGDAGSPGRQALIASLFNHDDPRFCSGGEGYSQDYIATADSFIRMVCRDSLCLDANSELIFASAESQGRLNGEEVGFRIILRQEHVGSSMIKWVIWDVEAPFLDFLEEDSTMLRFLPPSSGELDFKELLRAMRDVDHLHEYAHRDYNYEALDVFFYLLHSGQLEIGSILRVQYLVRDIPGWCMVLQDFNRMKENSGWLIHNLHRVEDHQIRK